MAQGLQTAGADFLVMPCNTAHYYYPIINQAVDIPVINLIDCVLEYVRREYPDCTNIGLLASPATQITKLYEQIFNPAKIKVAYPDSRYQDLLFQVIKDVKKGAIGDDSRQIYTEVCDHLLGNGLSLAIVACTELGTLESSSSLNKIDAADLLARKVIQLAKS